MDFDVIFPKATVQVDEPLMLCMCMAVYLGRR